jgi:hypothetical protein
MDVQSTRPDDRALGCTVREKPDAYVVRGPPAVHHGHDRLSKRISPIGLDMDEHMVALLQRVPEKGRHDSRRRGTNGEVVGGRGVQA